MRILGLIPVRGGSKGVPGKNIKLLGSKPLLAYSIEAAILSKQFAKVIVSTESQEIAKLALELGAEVPFLRPEVLATDTAKSIDVVIHVLEELSKSEEHFDAVCLLQATYPFRKEGMIEEAIALFKSKNADSLVSVLPVPSHFNPHWIFESNKDAFLELATGEEEIIARRQDLPNCYFRDGAIYITSVDVILNNKTFFGKKLAYVESDSNFYINIDTFEDWKKAEDFLLKNPNLRNIS